MPEISAREALRYATDDEMLKLYGVLVGGWALTIPGQFAATGSGVIALVGIIVLLAGITASVSALVAIAYKVLVESRPG